MPVAEIVGLLVMVAGTIMGVIGFVPMLLALRLAHNGRMRPNVGVGLIAIVVSLTFLMAVVAAVWRLAPDSLILLSAGILAGFFAMCAYAVVITQRSSRR